MSHARPVSFVLSVLITLVVASASAQSTRDQVRALNREAIEAYHQLEIDHALELLERALVIADQGGLGGQELARTHANLGIIAVAGLADNGRGMTHFQSALQADPNVQLDPQISTPEVNAIFQQARARLAGQAVGTSTPPTADQSSVDTTTGLTHTPAQEQLLRTPLPVYVAVADSLTVSRIVVRYRARGMRNFAELALTAMVDGYGIELPCTDIFEPQVEYYIVAFAADGSEVGHVGSAQTPRTVRIVRARRYAPPALPGRVPPPQCSDHECPPNLPSCRRNTPANATPRTQSDDGDAPGGEEEDSSDDDVPRLYIQLGGVVGAAHARENMVADRLPADGTSTTDAFISPADDPSCDAPPGEYCVRVTQAGFMPVYGLRLMVGYFVVPRVAISVGARYQILAGEGTLSHVLLSFRTEFLATKPAADGFRALVHIGTSFGQIQVRPQQRATDVEPYAQVGLGSAQVGGTFGYRFMRNVGVFITPEAHVFYRRLSVALDVALGLEAAF